MKKVLATVLALVMALALCSVSWADVKDTDVAKIGDTGYATLRDAVAAVSDGGVITVLKDSVGVGIGTFTTETGKDVYGNDKISAKGFTIDFNGHTYTLKDQPAGSTGTETQGFHLEWAGKGNENHSVIFKNGVIDVAKDRDPNMMMVVQNYCNLKLENMVIDGRNLANGWGTYTYVTGNSCGNVVVENSDIIANDGSVAFDIDGNRGNYSAASVTITKASSIIGKFEVSPNNTLSVTGGVFSEDMNSAANKQYVAADAAVASADGMSVIGADNIVSVAQAGVDVEVLVGSVTFTDIPAGTNVTNNGTGTVTVNDKTVAAGASYTVPAKYYYYSPSTTTSDTTTKGSPKTFDAGIALYVGMALTSVTGLAYTGKKKF